MSTAFHDLSKKDQILFLAFMEERNPDQLLSWHEVEQAHDWMLDECFEECKIAGYTYSTSEALQAVDPTAYRCSVSDYSAERYVEVCASDDGKITIIILIPMSSIL